MLSYRAPFLSKGIGSDQFPSTIFLGDWVESLARYTYNIERRAQARERAQARRRAKAHGDFKPSDSSKKRVRKGIKEKSQVSGLRAGDIREALETNIAEEIEGTGGFGPGDIEFTSTAAIHQFPGISRSFRLRFSHLTDRQFGQMLRNIRAQQQAYPDRKPPGGIPEERTK